MLELDVQIDTLFLRDMLDLYNSMPMTEFYTAIGVLTKALTTTASTPAIAPVEEKQEPTHSLSPGLEKPDQVGVKKSMMHFKLLHIHPIRITFTLSLSAGSLTNLP